MKIVYPWSAVVGQDALKQALLFCAIDPAIGGVLVQGPRGVAKTTLARALAELVTGAFVELPLGATEERVTGSLSLDAALRDGRVEFAPGLLARAHDGVLYVDEVNLLPDALVDLLLDAAASGWNQVERDGVSHAHHARFVLIGSMNPEEGELRPQLTDRFGLSACAEGTIAPAERRQIVARRLEFDSDPSRFRESYAARQRELAERCNRARERVSAIRLDGPALEHVSERCFAAGVEGIRADLAMLRAARARAAWHERSEITSEDVEAVAELALAHRRSRDGGEGGGGPRGPSEGGAPRGWSESGGRRGQEEGERNRPGGPGAHQPGGTSIDGNSRTRGAAARERVGSMAQSGGAEGTNAAGGAARESDAMGSVRDRSAGGVSAGHEGGRGAMPPRPVVAERPPARLEWLQRPRAGLGGTPRSDAGRAGQDRRGRAERAAPSGARALGRASRQTSWGRLGSIDWFATLMSARRPRRDQIRYRPRRRPVARLWMIAVDCSTSMVRSGGLGVAKGIAHAIEVGARRTGAHVAIISFRGASAQLEVSSAPGRTVLGRTIAAMGGGGGTPLRRALSTAYALCRSTRWRALEIEKCLLVLTDGRTRESVGDFAAREPGLARVVVDCEQGRVRLGRSAQLAAALGARLVPARE